MQPSDAQTPQAPAEPPQKEEKVGFFAKLFGKKPKETPMVPPHGSQTPPPQLGNDETAPTDPVGAAAMGSESSATSDASAAPASPAAPATPEAPSAPMATPGEAPAATPSAGPTMPGASGTDEQKPL